MVEVRFVRVVQVASLFNGWYMSGQSIGMREEYGVGGAGVADLLSFTRLVWSVTFTHAVFKEVTPSVQSIHMNPA